MDKTAKTRILIIVIFGLIAIGLFLGYYFGYWGKVEEKEEVKITYQPSIDMIDESVKMAGRNWEEKKIAERTFERTFYLDNITYLAEDGNYKPIETKLVKAEGDYQYENTTNVFGTYFKDEAQADDLIKFQIGERAVTYSFVEPNKVKGEAKNNTFAYPNIYENIDAQYTITPSQLLEELIAKKEVTIDKITQKIRLVGVYFEKQEDGSIKFYDEKTKKIVWVIPRPIMYEKENPDKINFDLHYEITKEGDYYLLEKVIDEAGKEWLKSASYPVVIDATTTFYPPQPAPTEQNGYVYASHFDYLTAHNATSGTSTYIGTTSYIGQRNSYGPNDDYIYRTFLWFDTSSIGSGINTLNSAVIGLYGNSAFLTTNNFDISIVQGNQNANPPGSSDYNDYYTTLLAPGLTTNTTINPHFITTGYNTFTLNANGIASINKTGITKFAVLSSRDLSSTAPGSALPGSDINEYVLIYDADQAGTSQDPYLTVTYTTPEPPGLYIDFQGLTASQIELDLWDMSGAPVGEDFWLMQHSTDGVNYNTDQCAMYTNKKKSDYPSMYCQFADYDCTGTTKDGIDGFCYFYHTGLAPNSRHYYRVEACSTNCSAWVYRSGYTMALQPNYAPTLAVSDDPDPYGIGNSYSYIKLTNFNGIADEGGANQNPVGTNYIVSVAEGGYIDSCTDNGSHYLCPLTSGISLAEYKTKAQWLGMNISASKPIIINGLSPNIQYKVAMMSRNGDGRVNNTAGPAATKYTRANNLLAPTVENKAGEPSKSVHLTLNRPLAPGNNPDSTKYAVQRKKLNEASWQYYICPAGGPPPGVDGGGACETSNQSDITNPNSSFWARYNNPGNLTWGGGSGINLSTTEPNACYYFRGRSKNNENEINTTFGPESGLVCSLMDLTGVEFGTITTTSIEAKAKGEFLRLADGSSGVRIQNLTKGQDSGWLKDTNFWNSSSLDPNKSYTFQADARNYLGAANNSVTAVKYTLANTPISLVIQSISNGNNTVSGDAWMNLTWGANSNPLGTEYKIEISGDGSNWSNKGTTTNLSFVSGNLNENTRYWHQVRAKNGDGVWSDPSNVVNDYTYLDPPTDAALTIIVPSGISNVSELNLSVTPPPNSTVGSTGSEFFRYDNVCSAATSLVWNTGIYTDTDTGLSSNTLYKYKVRYRNASGIPTSENPTCKTRYTRANAPINLNHDPPPSQTISQMKWTWQSGGRQKEFYAWNNNPVGNSNWTPSTSWIQSGLSANTQYTFSVKARNQENVETASVSYLAYTSAETPSNLSIELPDINWSDPSNPGKTKLTIKWVGGDGTPPDNPSGTNYVTEVTINPEEGTAYSGTGLTYDDDKLGTNLQYGYRVRAENGNGDPTGWTSEVKKYTRANVPNAPKLTKKSGTEINIKLNPNDGNPHGPAPTPDTQYAVCAVHRECSNNPGQLCNKDDECPQPGGSCITVFEKYVEYDDVNSKWIIGVSDCTEDGVTGDWHIFSDWGGANGVDIEVEPGKHTFKAIAKNEDAVVTKFGPTATLFLVKNNIVGWAWSDQAGWLSMNCLNFYANPQNYYSCGQADNWGANTYFELGRDINPIEGYAWSGAGKTSNSTAGLGWISFNTGVCTNDTQRACTVVGDCKSGGACQENAGTPPGYCSNNITLPCTADGECGGGSNYCVKGFGYCYNGSGVKYGFCSSSPTTSCLNNTVCNVDATDHCVYYTCDSNGTNGKICPSSGTCKKTSTANADGLTRQIEGYARVLSQKEAGEAQGKFDWGWIKLAGQYGGPGQDANTVGLWHFNESANNNADDVSFNNNDGTLYNFTAVDRDKWVEGKIGRGLKFDGLDDYVDAGSDISLNITDKITIEAWVKPLSYPNTWNSILSKESWGYGYTLLINGNDKKAYYYQQGVSPNNVNSGATTIPIGSWSYVVGVFDGTKLLIYVNGVLANSVDVAGSLSDNAGDILYIGKSIFDTGRWFDGTIDEVRITNRALTPKEIGDEYIIGPYLLSLLEVDSQAFFADPDVNANEVKLYSAFGFGWSSRTSPGFGWIQFMPAGAIIGIPWLQTLYGDIFAKGNIELAPPPRGTGEYTATYLIQANGSIVGIPGYYMSTSTGPPTSQYGQITEPPSGYYQYQPDIDVLSKVDVEGLKAAPPGGKNKYGYNVVSKSGGDISAGSGIGATPILNQTVYYFDHDSTVGSMMTIKNGGAGVNGSGLIIVDGDLTINKDIRYEYGNCSIGSSLCYEAGDPICGGTGNTCVKSDITNAKQLASVAWLVRGNIYINPLVRHLAGVFVAVGKNSEDGIISTARAKEFHFIANDNNDAWAQDITIWSGNPQAENNIDFGRNSINEVRQAFLRWQINIPKEAEIKKAYIKFNALGGSGDFTAKIDLLKDGSSDFSSDPFNREVYTNDEVDYKPEVWENGKTYDSVDITKLVQNFIDQATYPTANSYIGIRISQGDATSGKYRSFAANEHSSSEPAELVIEYSDWNKEYNIPDNQSDATAWGANAVDYTTAGNLKFGWTDSVVGEENRPNRSFLRFGPIDIPSDSEIKKANIIVQSPSSQNSDFKTNKARIGLLDNVNDNTSEFNSNPYNIALAGSEIAFMPTAWAQDEITLPEITSLIQKYIDGGSDDKGYSPGKFLGLRIIRDTNETVDPNENQYREFSSKDNNNPAKLTVEYRSRLDVSGLMAARGYHFDREYVKGLEPAEQIVYDGRVMVNTPPGLGDFGKLLPIYQQVIP